MATEAPRERANATRVMACGARCTHTWQDEVYGRHMRVHNRVVKEEGAWRCTACGHVTIITRH